MIEAEKEQIEKEVEAFQKENPIESDEYWDIDTVNRHCNLNTKKKRFEEELYPCLHECNDLENQLQKIMKTGKKNNGEEIPADSAPQLSSEQLIKQAGKKGEQEVEYALKWLRTSEYKTISRDCHSKYSEACILLRNSEFIDEMQEYDHIIIGKPGIFLIETKNLAGIIRVTSYGDWIQIKNGERKGIKNPVQQCDRHSALVKSIVGNVPIISIICIANDGAIIENRENCPIPIVNVTMLQRFIENTQTNSTLTEHQINELVSIIERHKVHRYDM